MSAEVKVSPKDLPIIESVRKAWPSKDVELRVDLNTPTHVRVRVWSMYSAPGLSFAQLMALSQEFSTQQIDAGDTFADGGCETCDYCSEYGFTLDIKGRSVGAALAAAKEGK